VATTGRGNHDLRIKDKRNGEKTMKNIITNFIRDEQGQDLIEYTLLLAFVALASAALFVNAGTSVSGVWTTANSRLAAASTAAAS
jgi:Flp pilus assembly pilin Flp